MHYRPIAQVERVGPNRTSSADPLNDHFILLFREHIVQKRIRYAQANKAIHVLHLHVTEQILAFQLFTDPLPLQFAVILAQMQMVHEVGIQQTIRFRVLMLRPQFKVRNISQCVFYIMRGHMPGHINGMRYRVVAHGQNGNEIVVRYQ